jgi:hypothetical protein
MKVLNLQCAHQHSFEGWFGSEEDFQSQFARGLVECPMCSSKAIVKMPSAPKLNLGVPRTRVDLSSHPSQATAADAQDNKTPESGLEAPTQAGLGPELQAAFFKALRQVLANTEDVGDNFANRARAMHYGDAQPRGIRGRATQQETVELVEEGIDVMVLPVPAALKETLQ